MFKQSVTAATVWLVKVINLILMSAQDQTRLRASNIYLTYIIVIVEE